MVSTDQFRQEIRSRLELASAQGRPDLTIECGELYRSVSKLPVFDPWMIFCCNAMRAEMAMTDRLIFDDSKASLLTIHYKFPRHQTPPPKSSKRAHAQSVTRSIQRDPDLDTDDQLAPSQMKQPMPAAVSAPSGAAGSPLRRFLR